MATVTGESVEVIDPGLLNADAGPDFFNAKIRIGGSLWVGNVEIHVRAGDWYRHGHNNDRAYDTVILHVVAVSECDVRRPDGSVIPQMILKLRPGVEQRSNTLLHNNGELACAAHLTEMPTIYIKDWLTSLSLERIQRKAAHISELAASEGGDWQHAVYVVLARTLGFHTNSDAFERLALSMPLRKLRRHADHPLTIQGMLFGQAGFLDGTAPTAEDAEYMDCLRREYRFMADKFSLHAPGSLGWRMARMRPQHFPMRSLAALAQFVCDGFKPGTEVFSVKDADHARALFDIGLRGYWAHRCRFGPATCRSDRVFSKSSLDVLMINVAIPAIYAYGQYYDKERMCADAIDMLTATAPEDNRKVRLFTGAGIACGDAFTSQALIELQTCYCEPRKCLYCRLGHRIVSHGDSRHNNTTTWNLSHQKMYC